MTPSDDVAGEEARASAARARRRPRGDALAAEHGVHEQPRELGLPAHLGERAAPPAAGLGRRMRRGRRDRARRRRGSAVTAGRLPRRPDRHKVPRHAHGPRTLRARGRAARRPARLHGLARAIRPSRSTSARSRRAAIPTSCRRSSRSSRPRRASAACGTCSCPTSAGAPGCRNLEYAPLAEVTGRSPDIAPEALNCAAPDTGQHGGAGDVRHPGAAGALARAAARGRDPLVLRDDRAGRGVQRRDEHRGRDRAATATST